MELRCKQITSTSPEVLELEDWKFHKNSEPLNTFILNKGSNYFVELIEEHLDNRFTTPKAFVFGNSEELLGLALTQTFINRHDGNNVCTISYICVNPAHMHENIGTKMLEYILENKNNILGKKKIHIFLASVVKENIISQKLFKKVGFSIEPNGENSFYASYANPKIYGK